MTFIERHGLVQYHKTRSGKYACIGPCELHRAGEDYRGLFLAGEDYCGPFLVFDHCHVHGWIRGVICQSWNMQLAGGLETRLRAGTIRFECKHRHQAQSSVNRCMAHLRSASGRWLRADGYLRNCPDCQIPALVIRYPELVPG